MPSPVSSIPALPHARPARGFNLASAALVALLAAPGALLAQSKTVPATGVASEGVNSARWASDYNLFTRHPTLGLTQAQVNTKLSQVWLRMSGQLDDPAVWSVIKTDAADPTLAYADMNVEHPNNTWDGGPRVCSEGQGWIMMLAVQANDQAMFNKLWRFTRKYLQYTRTTGDLKRGYLFCWQCLPQPGGGVLYKNSNNITLDGVAPDGDQWITAALYAAHGRWGSGAGELNYHLEADLIADSMLNVEANSGYGKQYVTNVFQNNQVCYIPADFVKGPTLKAWQLSDPSYCIPGFYQFFATVGGPANQAKWTAIANYARGTYLQRATGHIANSVTPNSLTGIAPYITTLDGTGYNCLPSNGEGDKSGIQTGGDGIRVPALLGFDYMWWSDNSANFTWYKTYGNKLLSAFHDPVTFNPYINSSPFGNVWSFPYNYKRYVYGSNTWCDGRDINYINWQNAGSDMAHKPGSGNHNEACSGSNGPAAHLSDRDFAWNFVEELWGANQPRNTGVQATSTWGGRYWDGILYALGLYNTAGAFKPYGVGPGSSPPPPSTTDTPIYTDALATGWSDWSYTPKADFNNTTPTHAASAKSIKYIFDSTGWSTLSLRSATSVPVAATDRISCYVYSTGAPAAVNVGIQTGDSGGVSATKNVTLAANAWTLVEVPFSQIGSPASIKRVNFTAIAGTVYFDQLKIAPFVPPPAPDTSDYNFETTVQGWSNAWASPVVTAVAVSTDRAYAGTKSLKVTLNNTTGIVKNVSILITPPTGLAAGQTVSFRYWVPSGTGGITAGAPFTQGTGVGWTANWSNFTKGNWTTVALTVPANIGTIQNLGYQVVVDPGFNGSFYLDAIDWP